MIVAILKHLENYAAGTKKNKNVINLLKSILCGCIYVN